MKKIFVSTIGMLFVVSTTMFGMEQNHENSENFKPENKSRRFTEILIEELVKKNLPKRKSNIYLVKELDIKNCKRATTKYNENNHTTMEKFVNLLIIERRATLAKFKKLLYEEPEKRTFEKRKKNKGYGYFANS